MYPYPFLIPAIVIALVVLVGSSALLFVGECVRVVRAMWVCRGGRREKCASAASARVQER